MSYFPQQLTHKIAFDPSGRVMTYSPMTDEQYEVAQAGGRRAARMAGMGEDDAAAVKLRGEMLRSAVAECVTAISGVDDVMAFLKECPRATYQDILGTVLGASMLSDVEGKA